MTEGSDSPLKAVAGLDQAGHLFEAAPCALLHLDRLGRVVRANSAARELFGYAPSELVGCELCQCVRPSHRARLLSHVTRVSRGRLAFVDLEVRRASGAVIPVRLNSTPVAADESVSPGCLSAVSDRSEVRLAERRLQRATQELEQLANFDPLTGLRNRRAFHEHLRRICLRRARRGFGAVVFLDLDNFKTVNDELGHEAGDQLLRQAGQRLLARMRRTDTASRLGGDEFAVLLEDLHGMDHAVRIAEGILKSLTAPVFVAGRMVVLRASVGVRVANDDETDPATILRQADAAMYRAKREGGSRVQLYERRMEPAAPQPDDELRTALREGQLFLEFQPKVDAQDHSVRGVEALVRWRHPRRGTLWPKSFIEAAEISGFIHQLGRWVLEAACRQATAWHSAGVNFGRVSVNVSPSQFDSSGFVPELRRLLDTTGLPPTSLDLELTESAVVRDPERAAKQLSELRTLGVTTTLDDFGTGHSSMSLLSRLPLSRLKLDASFVAGLPDDAGHRAIAGAMTTLAHDLGMTITAEGVESAAQADYLRERGCDEFQGYHFGPPAPATEMFRPTVLLVPPGSTLA